MIRTVVKLAVLLDIICLGVGIYARFFYEPAPLGAAHEVTDEGKQLVAADQFEELAKTNPVKMLEECVIRYQREVKGGFTATLIKKERPKGDPAPPAEPPEEVIHLFVRGDVPDPETHKSCVEVLMKWQSGARVAAFSEVHGALYSEQPPPTGTGGELVTWRPTAPFKPTMRIAAKSMLAQDSSRYCIRDAGVYRGMLRTYEVWKQRKEAGTLTTEYLGKQVVEKVGGRMCYVVRRTCAGPEVDAFEVGGEADMSPGNVAKVGFNSVTLMIDAETWLQVGTELHLTGPDGKQILIGSYYFRDIDLHPYFAPDTFTEANMNKK